MVEPFGSINFFTDSEFCLFTDSAGSVGFAAIWRNHWCAEKWPLRWKIHGLLKNSVEIWGNFINHRNLISTDNKGVMYSINCLSSKSPPVSTLLRYMVSKCLTLNIWLKAKYIPGKLNMVADALTWLQMSRFFNLLPDADKIGIVCHLYLWEII